MEVASLVFSSIFEKKKFADLVVAFTSLIPSALPPWLFCGFASLFEREEKGPDAATMEPIAGPAMR